MRRALVLGIVLLALPAIAEGPLPHVEPIPADKEAGVAAFETVYSVLVSPRCMNCHPAGDVPLQGDKSTPHAMGITRASPENGLPCKTCHRPGGIQGDHLPPANPHWALAPADQVFEGRTAPELCEQLNDPTKTGGRDLQGLLDHVTHDALVLWGWDPGADRTRPPVDHPTFSKAFATWVGAGGPCPTPPR